MTVAPHQNKYIFYFDNIRMIQEHLCNDADLHLIPKINNTNVDRSLAILHSATVSVIYEAMMLI
jgi:2-phosphoglycerate kinase